MSNFLAIATATATLRALLHDAVTVDVPGADVKTTRPDLLVGKDQPTEVNIYLYQVTPNSAYRNNDLPTRRADGSVIQRPTVALDLHYMISFYGNENDLEPQRLLGSVARTLHAQPYLTREQIRHAVLNNTTILGASDLADQIELVKFSPLHLSLEEFSKIWSIFYQIPYVLSVAYQASLVLIEEEVSTQNALPVLARNIYTAPFHQPVVDTVLAQQVTQQPAGAPKPPLPITLDSTLLIQGHDLDGGKGTLVQIDGIVVQPTGINDTQILLPLPTTSGTQVSDGSPITLASALRAGVQGLQVIHRMQMGSDANNDALNWHRGVESNVTAFVLRPTLATVTPGAGIVTVTLRPVVSRPQRILLLLNQFNAGTAQPGTPAARAYSFVAKPKDQAWKDLNGQPVTDPTKFADTDSTDTIIFTIAGVVPGPYLARVQVDGAESPLSVDTNSQSPTFNRFIGPQVTL